MPNNNSNDISTGMSTEGPTDEARYSVDVYPLSQKIHPDTLSATAKQQAERGEFKNAQRTLSDEQIANLGNRTDDLKVLRGDIREQQIKVRNDRQTEAESAFDAAMLDLNEIAELYQKLCDDQLWEDEKSDQELLEPLAKRASALADDSWPEDRLNILKSILKHRLDTSVPDRPYLFDTNWLSKYNLYLENARLKFPEDTDIKSYLEVIFKARDDLRKAPDRAKGYDSRAITHEQPELIRHYEKILKVDRLQYVYEPMVQGDPSRPDELTVDQSKTIRVDVGARLKDLYVEHAENCVQAANRFYKGILPDADKDLTPSEWNLKDEGNRQLNVANSLAELRKNIHLGLIWLNPKDRLPQFRDVTRVIEQDKDGNDTYLNPRYPVQLEAQRDSLVKAFETALEMVERLLDIQAKFDTATLDELYYFYQHYPKANLIERYIKAKEEPFFRDYEKQISALCQIRIEFYTDDDLEKHEKELGEFSDKIAIAPPNVKPTLPTSRERINTIIEQVNRRFKTINDYRRVNKDAAIYRNRLAQIIKEQDWTGGDDLVATIQQEAALQNKLQDILGVYWNHAGPTHALKALMTEFESAAGLFGVDFEDKDDTAYQQVVDQHVTHSQTIKGRWNSILEGSRQHFEGGRIEEFQQWGQGRAIHLLAKAICNYVNAVELSSLAQERLDILDRVKKLLSKALNAASSDSPQVIIKSITESITWTLQLVEWVIKSDKKDQDANREVSDFWNSSVAPLIDDMLFEKRKFKEAFEALDNAEKIPENQRKKRRRELVQQWVEALEQEMQGILAVIKARSEKLGDG